MNKVDYLDQDVTESLFVEKEAEMEAFGVHERDGVVFNQTDDVQQLFVAKEEVPLERRSSLAQLDSEPLYIKEEEEELWSSQDEAETPIKFPLTVIVKNEDDEEEDRYLHFQSQMEGSREAEPSSSLIQSFKTETDEEDCGGPEPDWNHDPTCYFQLNADEKDSPETEVSDEDEFGQEPLSDFGSEVERDECFPGMEALRSDVNCNGGHDVAKATFSCLECDKQYSYKQSLHRHMKCHSTSLDETKSGLEDEELHTKGKKKNKTFICDICGQKFNQRTNLSTHRRVHTGERPYKCDVCGKRFTQRGNLRNHRRIHTGEKPFICDFCGERFRNQGILQAHMKVHTGEKPFACDVCGRKFSRKVHFNTHMRVHTGERPFGCGICGKEFSHKTHFQEHIRVHTGEKPFSCGACGKRFRLQCNLKRHIRVHTGEKPFACSQCSKTFSCNAHRKRHMKTHTGEKPFACDVCAERFTGPGLLRTHMRAHTGEKPFSCDVCGKTFMYISALKRHAVVHMGEKPFCCDVCGGRFSQQTYLRSHMKTHSTDVDKN
ncbi:gastrula zinc finger protein XlCGF57.1 [Nematolebias whitei]|uniref:gastrula zinc finger protein XlCGF57.1 n=1 Tax=Nematolebias whitei TaxID=451745 RepID=UPI00189C1FAE|nr:gastrula zinc finger protein XlCGF57.1 [Nematolebias whitei]